MSILTDRLRKQCDADEPIIWVPDVQAAADEIDRLRAELEWVRERMSGFCAGSWETTIAARVGKALDQSK